MAKKIKRTSKFHNISFEDFVKILKGKLYAYEISKDSGVVSLDIYSTSLSELDDEDNEHLGSEGFLQSFSYTTQKEVNEDLKTATKIFKMDFEVLEEDENEEEDDYDEDDE